jgi:hypothetical protein
MAIFQKSSVMPQSDERSLYKIMIADGRAADRHEHVAVIVPSLSDRGLDRGLPVGNDAEIDHLCSGGGKERCDADRVRRYDLVVAGRFARGHEFVSRGEDRDARLAQHRDRRPVHRGGERQPAGIEQQTGFQQSVARLKIQAAAADMAARRSRLDDLDPA